jgi:hypothetical protein
MPPATEPPASEESIRKIARGHASHKRTPLRPHFACESFNREGLSLRRMRFGPHTVLSIEGDCPHAVKEDEN